MEWIPNLILFVIIVVQQITHTRERRELYNRIMARNLKEFQTNPQRPPPESRNFVAKGIEKARREMGGE